MAQSTALRATRFLLTTLILDVALFPIWWYTRGTLNALRFFGSEVSAGVEGLSLVILFKNLLKPMYGDYTKTGRIISFFLRIILFFVRAVVFVLWIALLVLFVLLWLAALPLTLYLFIRTLLA